MSDPASIASWWEIGWVIGGAIVVVVAALALTILGAAVAIRKHAARALAAGERIRANTMVLWDIENTNEVAAEIGDSTGTIGRHAGALADALEHAGIRGGQ